MLPLKFLGGERHDQLRGRRKARGTRASLRRKSANREIGFMADASNHRKFQKRKIARATTSSLNAHRSSSEPPPRATGSARSANFVAGEIIHKAASDLFLRKVLRLPWYFSPDTVRTCAFGKNGDSEREENVADGSAPVRR